MVLVVSSAPLASDARRAAATSLLHASKAPSRGAQKCCTSLGWRLRVAGLEPCVCEPSRRFVLSVLAIVNYKSPLAVTLTSQVPSWGLSLQRAIRGGRRAPYPGFARRPPALLELLLGVADNTQQLAALLRRETCQEGVGGRHRAAGGLLGGSGVCGSQAAPPWTGSAGGEGSPGGTGGCWSSDIKASASKKKSREEGAVQV